MNQPLFNELQSSIEELREFKEELYQQLLEEEEEKQRVELELSSRHEKLEKINDYLMRASNEKKQLFKTIQEAEEAKFKIMENFKTLLHVLKKENQNYYQ